jgi:hypothetical protein
LRWNKDNQQRASINEQSDNDRAVPSGYNAVPLETNERTCHAANKHERSRDVEFLDLLAAR